MSAESETFLSSLSVKLDMALRLMTDRIGGLTDRIETVLPSWLIGALESIGVSAHLAIIAVTCLIGLTMVVFFRAALRRNRTSAGDDSAPDLSQFTRGPIRVGLLAGATLFVFIGGWSVLAPLASASLAPGIVSPDGSRKTIQHLEGGIIRSILVREGDSVSVGQALITLDDTEARARLAELQERYLHYLATEARLFTERAGRQEIVFPDELAQSGDARILDMTSGQTKLLQSRQTAQSNREAILRSRVRQLNEQNLGFDDVIAAQNHQIELIAQEIKATRQLYERGLARLPRLLALERAQADIEADKAMNRARIAQNLQQIGETEIQLISTREQVIERVNDELIQAQQLLAELRSQIPSREDRLSRTVIRAPISGKVMNIRVTTETGVVRPGDALLEIVPDNVRLIIDARVKPIDIDRIRPGMEARVLLTAYRQRNLPLIHGTLRSISADSLVDERTGEAYFLAKIEVNAGDLASLENVELSPGMPADVMIIDDERTLVDYLLDPVSDSLSRSFREN